MKPKPTLAQGAALLSSTLLFALYLAYQSGCIHPPATTPDTPHAAAPPSAPSRTLIYGSKSAPAFTTHQSETPPPPIATASTQQTLMSSSKSITGVVTISPGSLVTLPSHPNAPATQPLSPNP